MAQWLRLHASTAGGTGSTPGQGTKTLHAAQPTNQTNKKQHNVSVHPLGTSTIAMRTGLRQSAGPRAIRECDAEIPQGPADQQL